MVAFLKKKGHWVRAVDIEFPEFRKELWSQADEITEYDLRRYNAVHQGDEFIEDLFKYVGWIFHFAADMGGVGYFHSDADQRAARNNMLIDLNVLNALFSNQRMFFSSSACAYPTNSGKVLKESMFGGAPADQKYGEEKRLMTILCDQPNTRVGLLHTVYGSFQEYEGIRMKFPTAITRKVIEAKSSQTYGPPIKDGLFNKTGETVIHQKPIEIWGDGTQVRTFLFIQDALEKIYRVMDSEKYEGPVNIGSDEEVTVKEIADLLCEYEGITPHYTFNKSKPTGVLSRSSDNTKFNRIYGEVPQTSAKDGFKHLHSWLKNQLNQDHQVKG